MSYKGRVGRGSGMAFDAGLVERIREVLAERPAAEKHMFGGLAFLSQGHIACAVLGEELVVRVGTAGYAAALVEPGVREFDFTGRPMAGWVVVSAPALEEDAQLARWLERGLAQAAGLAPRD